MNFFLAAVPEPRGKKIIHRDIEAENLAVILAGCRAGVLDTDHRGWRLGVRGWGDDLTIIPKRNEEFHQVFGKQANRNPPVTRDGQNDIRLFFLPVESFLLGLKSSTSKAKLFKADIHFPNL